MYTVEIWETHGTHSTTTHHLHLHSTSIIHLHSHSTPFCHISTERSTNGADILLKGEVKIHQKNEEAIWPWCGAGQPHHLAGRPATSPSINPTPSLLLSASNTTLAPEFRIPFQNFVVEFLLRRSSVGVRKSERKFGCESSAKILRKRERCY